MNKELSVVFLKNLSHDLWWSWNSDAGNLFSSIDPKEWEVSGHNPGKMLSSIGIDKAAIRVSTQERLSALADNIAAEYASYKTHSLKSKDPVAYFSAEFGIHGSLPIYAGGLGILAGDHLKSASDIALNLIGIGLFYSEGYFRQKIDVNAGQVPLYVPNKPEDLPVEQVLDETGKILEIPLELPDGICRLHVWLATVGRIKLYLLDSNVEGNTDIQKKITARLYAEGGRREVRLMQEMILGIGGIRVLRALGIAPGVCHINEGHSAFLLMELASAKMKSDSITFSEALKDVGKKVLFTTHTPVKEGLEVFPPELIKDVFPSYLSSIGITLEEMMAAGVWKKGGTGFNMTVFALRYAEKSNAVSALNGAVCRKMWKGVAHSRTKSQVTIGSITNGVHHPTWMAEEWNLLITQYCGMDWKDKITEKSVMEKIRSIPDKDIWNVHNGLRKKLVEKAKLIVQESYLAAGVDQSTVSAIVSALDPARLTLGFARRFATYKRAALLFRDPKQLDAILLDPKRPVQILFAGKAHPADTAGQGLIKRVIELSLQKKYLGKLAFLEGYDIEIAGLLVQGVDVWLNTPIRPYEASGTSGEKAAMNGVLNCSIDDGWWPEGYNGKNGWLVKGSIFVKSPPIRDRADSDGMYHCIRNKVMPLFFQRKEGIPEKWIMMMKESIITLGMEYNTHRMVGEYYSKYYSKIM